MERIDVKTGFLCNNNCLFCVQAHKKKFGNKTFDQLAGYLEASFPVHNQVVFTGGEPTIRQDIVELVRKAKQLGYSTIQIQSNGRMFAYKDFCRKIIKAGATEFALAIHGHIPELHDYLTGSAGSFKETLGGIKNLVALGQLVMTNTVVTKPNYRHLPDIARLLLDSGIRKMQFAFVHILGNAYVNRESIVPRKSLVEPFVKKAIEIGANRGADVTTEAIPYCFMRGCERFIVEKRIPHTKVFDLDYVIEDFTHVRQTEGKLKNVGCRPCRFFKKCEGPWREYPDLFGWEEFKAVSLR